MARIWREPSDGRGGLSNRDVSADSFDTQNISLPVHPRKRATGLRPLGPGERAAARACRERGLRAIDGGRA